MRVSPMRMAGALFGGLLTASIVVVSAVGSAVTATGDSCTAVGSGTAYTVNIAIPSGAPEQFGFAFGVLGATVTNVNVAGADGSFSTQALPPAATGAWVTLSPIEPGSAVASLVTSAPVKGSFSVVPVSTAQPQAGYFKPITCALASNPVVSNTFTVDRHATYDRSLKAWHLPVAIPGPGTVSAIEPEPTIGTAASHAAATTSPLIQVRKVGLTSSGKVTLTLRLTSHGQQIVAAKGSVRPKLDVSFAPKGGKPSSQLITLTLQRSVTEEGRMLESAWIPATRAFGEFSSWTGRGPRRGG